jgi:hypothetical protein
VIPVNRGSPLSAPVKPAPPHPATAERGLDRSDRQVFEREAGVKDDFVAAAR